jgi:hypothetical protein
MGIEPTSEAWEALNKILKAIELAALSFLRDGLNWKLDGNCPKSRTRQVRAATKGGRGGFQIRASDHLGSL